MTPDPAFTRIARLRSHRAYGIFLAGCGDEPIAWLARVQCEHIPSPYAYSPTKAILRSNIAGGEHGVIVSETSHRVYDVFAVSAELLKFKTEQEAEDWHIKYMRKPAA